MYKNFDPHKPYFYSVAMTFIMVGALLVALSLTEGFLNFIWQSGQENIFMKFAAGLIVMGIGYLHLEIELVRISRR